MRKNYLKNGEKTKEELGKIKLREELAGLTAAVKKLKKKRIRQR